MIFFPNCKINIGLSVIEKRPDNYHNLVTLFYPLKMSDALEILVAPEQNKDQFSISGIDIGNDVQNNLVLKAVLALRKEYKIPSLKIHLHKYIPAGAGLGGGSSDAANTIKALDKICKLQLSTEKMQEIAREIGSDCAFFIKNQSCIAYERGDQFSPAPPFSLKDHKILLILPNIKVSTQEAYMGIRPQKSENALETAIQQPISEWKQLIKNDFEKNVFQRHPTLGEIKRELYAKGALYASLSGSGSAVYGIFPIETANPPSLCTQYRFYEEMIS